MLGLYRETGQTRAFSSGGKPHGECEYAPLTAES